MKSVGSTATCKEFSIEFLQNANPHQSKTAQFETASKTSSLSKDRRTKKKPLEMRTKN